MKTISIKDLPDRVLAEWATAICLKSVKNEYAREVVKLFNERSLRADRPLMQMLLDEGCVPIIASHPLLHTLDSHTFETFIFSIISKTDIPEVLADLLFAASAHRMRFPKSHTDRIDAWVRRCTSHSNLHVRCRAIENRAILRIFSEADQRVIVRGLNCELSNAEHAAAIRALWYTLQNDRYRVRFSILVSRKPAQRRLNFLLSKSTRRLARPFYDDVRNAFIKLDEE